MITGVRVLRYKILKGVDIPIPDRLTVVVGPNGSGKSTLLLSINAVTRRLPPRETGFQGAVKLSELTSPSYSERDSWFVFDANQPIVPVTLGELKARAEGRKSVESVDSVQRRNLNMLQSRFLKLSSEVSSRVSYNETATPSLGDDGANLASVIGGYLKRGRTDIVEMITSSLTSLVPQIVRVWVENASLERDETEIISVGSAQYPVTRKKSYWGERLMFDTRSAKGLPAHEMSEGTLLATCVLTLLYGENPPNLLLMDDIDKGLHPRAIASLVEILKGIMEQRPELQIIATSHSPYLLDQIPIESVICMHVADDGYARAKPLTDHPEYDRWKDVMTAGEFWGTMGEEWVTRDEKAVAQ